MKSFFEVGASYLLRTVTMIYTGKLVAQNESELVIKDAAWIPETERWADTVAKGVFKEVEPYPADAKVILQKGALLDAVKVAWKLPREQK